MTNFIHFLYGKFVSDDELYISPRDLGFARGYAVYDFLVTYNNKPFKLAEHVERLVKSAEIIGLIIPWSKDQISTWVIETLDKNDQNIEKTVSLYLSGGVGAYMHQINRPTLLIIIDEKKSLPSSHYENGVKTKAVKYNRPYPEAKTTCYIEGIRQLSKIENNSITDIIYYGDSQVFEGAGTNLFALINGKLMTPKSHILEGITRNTLLEMLQLDLTISVEDFALSELLAADEIFISGSYSGIRGVVQINDKVIGNGKVGEITKEVSKQYKNYLKQYTSDRQFQLQ